MKFLDRVPETNRLNALADRHAAGLVAVWGRRRIGKSRLLAEWCHRHRGLYTVADASSEGVQRQYLAKAVDAVIPDFSRVNYPDWPALLDRLSAEGKRVRWRGPLVLDEFPNLVVACPSLVSVLQNWIDREARTEGLLVAIAGSSQRMMQGLVLDGSSPLYGRALEALHLQAIPAGWLGAALGVNDPLTVVRSFAIWGGVPRYWELAEPFGEDVVAAVDALALDRLGPLHEEPDRLLREELPSAVALRPLLDVIGNGANRVSEIAGRLNQPATSLSRPLARLLDMGLVRREIPFGEPERSSKKALYRIADPFFRFWFRAIAPYRALLVESPPSARAAHGRRFSAGLTATAWEDLCRSAVPHLTDALPQTGVSAPWGSASRWWGGNNPEWDIVAGAAEGPGVLLAEAKWSETAFAARELEALAAVLVKKRPPPPVQGRCTLVLFVPSVRARVPRQFGPVHVVTAAQVLQVLR